MTRNREDLEQGVNYASLVSPLADARPGQRSACQVDAGSHEPAGAAASGGIGSADAPDADSVTGGKRAGWKGGAWALSPEKKRKHTVSTRFNKDELSELDGLSTSVGLRRGEYLRVAAFQALPPTIPELNKNAWLELSKAASNLNQIAYQLNRKGVEVDVDLTEIENMLSYFRQILIDVGEAHESEN